MSAWKELTHEEAEYISKGDKIERKHVQPSGTISILNGVVDSVRKTEMKLIASDSDGNILFSGTYGPFGDLRFSRANVYRIRKAPKPFPEDGTFIRVLKAKGLATGPFIGLVVGSCVISLRTVVVEGPTYVCKPGVNRLAGIVYPESAVHDWEIIEEVK